MLWWAGRVVFLSMHSARRVDCGADRNSRFIAVRLELAAAWGIRRVKFGLDRGSVGFGRPGDASVPSTERGLFYCYH